MPLVRFALPQNIARRSRIATIHIVTCLTSWRALLEPSSKLPLSSLMPILHRFPAPVQNLVMDAISISRWPAAAWQEYLRDNISGLKDDPGPQAAIDAG